MVLMIGVKRSMLLAVWVLFCARLLAQDVSGRWEGVLRQEGAAGVFTYVLELQIVEGTIQGHSYCTIPDGSLTAHFRLGGFWEGATLKLQEVHQIAPKDAKWCFKLLSLRFQDSDGQARLEGDWRAEGCRPGTTALRRVSRAAPVEEAEEALPFSWLGAWTGHLSQSDRDYGFYFEGEWSEGGRGYSFIVSEDNGGSARHELRWQIDEDEKTLRFWEAKVVEKTDPRWKWCIKSGVLRLRREAAVFVLEGEWHGYIEGFAPDNPRARCASGTIYLEKPVMTQRVSRAMAQGAGNYAEENGRKVKLERIVEVRSPNIHLKVWDNGAVDGDVATIFLNGERILYRQRVSKRKIVIPVKLKADDNFLVLHADDLGDIPPNTVAVSVDDGHKEQIIILTSNLQESGAALIRHFRLE
jgi:hypothetical protein